MRAIVCIAHERENTVLLYRIVQMVTILRSGINVFMQNKSNCEDLSFKRLFYCVLFAVLSRGDSFQFFCKTFEKYN